ncbi:MAG: M20 family metallopeptidase [Verrucomicrobia bacterium]|jgi:acetylornithine deacetylase/succinyl-diaminopimelate desuccinylase family protein|nr:M20 family metallopeptidase [Verrucomicrobiota bacterium]
MAKLSAVAKLLRDLVALPSVNPAFLPNDSERTGEERIASYLTDLARKQGLEISRQNVLPGRKNLFVRLKPTGKVRRRIVLAPHLDVVPAEDKQFTPRVRNGRLHGRGACDTKGSVAAFFHALLELAKGKNRPAETEILFVGLVDEEYGQSGSRIFGERGPKADLAIAGEPTQLQVVTAHKGNLWLRFETRGKAAHGATPHLGKSAIHKMARITEVLLTEYADELRKRTHPLLGHPSINIGTIKGGSQTNVVPERCSIEIDRRTLPSETEESVFKEINRILAKRKLKVVNPQESRGVPCPPLETNPELPIVRKFLKAAKRRKPKGVDYFTDASPIAMGGTPAIVFGPGDIAQAHSADEWIDLDQLDQASAVILRFLYEQP